MRTRRSTIFPLAAVAFVLLLVGGCGGGGGGGSTPTAPGTSRLIDNVWVVEGNENHSFSLVCEECPAMAAAFVGEEFFEDEVSSLTGSFDAQNNVRFTVQRDGGADPVLFAGVFLDDDTMEMQADGETFRIVRDVM